MKLKFLVFETKAPAWVVEARQEYVTKIGHFAPLEFKTLKSPTNDRENAQVKRRQEAEILLKQIEDRDLLVLFDESGRLAKNSEDFSLALSRVVESGKATAVFCIGGPYGFDESVRERAASRWSLSPLTMNHWIAQLTALEQLYRGFTILKGIPYHNR